MDRPVFIRSAGRVNTLWRQRQHTAHPRFGRDCRSSMWLVPSRSLPALDGHGLFRRTFDSSRTDFLEDFDPELPPYV